MPRFHCITRVCVNDLMTDRHTAAWCSFLRADPLIPTGAWDHQAGASILPCWLSPNPNTAFKQDVGFEKPQHVYFSENRVMKNGCDWTIIGLLCQKKKTSILLSVVCVPSHSGISPRMFRLVLEIMDTVWGLGEHASLWMAVISRNCLHMCHSNKSLIYCFSLPDSEASCSCFKRTEPS